MNLSAQLKLLIDVYESAGSVQTGKYRTTVNELTDQLPATRPKLLEAAGILLVSDMHWDSIPGHPLILHYDKLLSEEDKGAGIAAIAAVTSGLPLAMARPYAYPLPGAIPVEYRMEYTTHTVYLNGIQRGDRVLLVDDTLSTGGTACALIQACNSVGAVVTGMHVLVEKLGYGGRERIHAQTGLDVSSVIGIRVQDDGSIKVERIFDGTVDLWKYRAGILL